MAYDSSLSGVVAAAVAGQAANVGFKLGTQDSLNTLYTNRTATNGVFYLTKDTHRLYIGNENGTVSPVNEGVITVSTISNLPDLTTGNHIPYQGQFYYIADSNILCVASGKRWVQINSDTNTYVSKFTNKIGANTSDNSANITHTIETKEVDGSKGQTYSNSFKIKGDGVSVTNESSSTENIVKITGDIYTISSEQVTSEAGTVTGVKIKLDSNLTDNDSEVELVSGNSNNNFSVNSDGKISLETKDTTNKSFGITPLAEGFEFSVTDTSNKKVKNTYNPTVTYGNNNTAKYQNGTLDLSVYSKSQIDELMIGLNAMTYKGTIGNLPSGGTGSAGSNLPSLSTTPPAEIRVGDTFLAISEITYANAVYPAQSLFIANGTESATTGLITSNLRYDVVKASGVKDTTYKFAEYNKGIYLQPSTAINNSSNSLELLDGDVITVTANPIRTNDGVKQKLTISHDEITAPEFEEKQKGGSLVGNVVNNQAPGTAMTVKVITDVETDGHGHITKFVTEDYELKDTNTSVASMTHDASVATASGVKTATVTQSLTLKNDSTNQNQTAKTSSFKLSSSSLEVSAEARTSTEAPIVSVNLCWGTF